MARQNGTDRNAQIANTIRDQLGHKALVMLGAYRLVVVGNGVQFRIKGCRRINAIRIVLCPDDTYSVTFHRVGAPGCVCFRTVTVASVDGVYVDSLHRTIEQHTGLATAL